MIKFGNFKFHEREMTFPFFLGCYVLIEDSSVIVIKFRNFKFARSRCRYYGYGSNEDEKVATYIPQCRQFGVSILISD